MIPQRFRQFRACEHSRLLETEEPKVEGHQSTNRRSRLIKRMEAVRTGKPFELKNVVSIHRCYTKEDLVDELSSGELVKQLSKDLNPVIRDEFEYHLSDYLRGYCTLSVRALIALNTALTECLLERARKDTNCNLQILREYAEFKDGDRYNEPVLVGNYQLVDCPNNAAIRRPLGSIELTDDDFDAISSRFKQLTSGKTLGTIEPSEIVWILEEMGYTFENGIEPKDMDDLNKNFRFDSDNVIRFIDKSQTDLFQRAEAHRRRERRFHR